MRIRTIKPEFWRSDDIKQLPRDIRLLFIGLWSYVDDNGVGVDDYRQIAADLFPLEDDPNEVRDYVRDGLARLARGLQIARYEVCGKAYLFITNWDKHQKVDRPGKPRYPRPGNPPTSANGQGPPPHPDHSRAARESLAPVTGEQGNRGTGEQDTGGPVGQVAETSVGGQVASAAKSPRDDVDRLCAHLAGRIEANGSKRPTVTRKWRDAARLMLDRDGHTEDQIRSAIDWCQDSEFWRANVMSMPKLREQYDRLRLEATRQRRTTQRAHESPTDQRIREFLAPVHTNNVIPLQLPGAAS